MPRAWLCSLSLLVLVVSSAGSARAQSVPAAVLHYLTVVGGKIVHEARP